MTDTVYWRNGPKLRQVPFAAAWVWAPAIVLIDPKYPHNVGAVVRTASCYGIGAVVYTGDRVAIAQTDERLPREERMRDYADVSVVNTGRPFDLIQGTPVAVEYNTQSETLPEFQHPPDPVYVFGAEDGTVPRVILRHCHRFVRIPTRHCLNLSVAVATVLYDRMVKSRD